MWSWVNCYLSGRHEWGKWCEPGAIFLRCIHCGRRSCGWAIDQKLNQFAIPSAKAHVSSRPVRSKIVEPARVLPFTPAAS